MSTKITGPKLYKFYLRNRNPDAGEVTLRKIVSTESLQQDGLVNYILQPMPTEDWHILAGRDNHYNYHELSAFDLDTGVSDIYVGPFCQATIFLTSTPGGLASNGDVVSYSLGPKEKMSIDPNLIIDRIIVSAHPFGTPPAKTEQFTSPMSFNPTIIYLVLFVIFAIIAGFLFNKVIKKLPRDGILSINVSDTNYF